MFFANYFRHSVGPSRQVSRKATATRSWSSFSSYSSLSSSWSSYLPPVVHLRSGPLWESFGASEGAAIFPGIFGRIEAVGK